MSNKKKRTLIQLECNTPFLIELKADIEYIAKEKRGITVAALVKNVLSEVRDSVLPGGRPKS